MTLSLDIEGLTGLQTYLAGAPEKARKAASLSLNQTADRQVIPKSRDLIQEQIAFPRGYITSEKLYVKERSNPASLEVKVWARDRTTSLLRFAARGPGRSISSVRVHTVRGVRRGFVIGLNSGNQGFAIQLRSGETMTNTVAAVAISKYPGLYLLYGPSVNQAFLSVASTLAPGFLAYLETEFLRQFTRDNL